MNHLNNLAILLFVLLVNCIHVQTREAQTLKSSEPGALRSQQSETKDVTFSYLTYRPAVYPLETFTKNLMDGEFQNAFSRIDFVYSPAQGDSQALAILLANNYVPVWLTATNRSNRTLYPREVIVLDTTGHTLSPIEPSELPSRFEKLNWNAVAANVYNFTILSVVLAATLYVGHIPMPNPIPEKGRTKPEQKPLFNPLMFSQEIKYDSLLFSLLPLEPGETRAGLLFFKQDSTPDWKSVSLRIVKNYRPLKN